MDTDFVCWSMATAVSVMVYSQIEMIPCFVCSYFINHPWLCDGQIYNYAHAGLSKGDKL